MNCPKCSSKVLRVYNSQIHEEQNCKSRWRICCDCEFRFTTVELLGKVRFKDGKPFKIEFDSEYELAGSGPEA